MSVEHGPEFLRFAASAKHAQLLREAEETCLVRRSSRRPDVWGRLSVHLGAALCHLGLRLQNRQAL